MCIYCGNLLMFPREIAFRACISCLQEVDDAIATNLKWVPDYQRAFTVYGVIYVPGRKLKERG